jgi:hypothetical protein
MGLVLAFLVGYAAGGKGSRSDYDDVVASARQVMNSEEFRTFVRILRTHLGGALTDLGGLVAAGTTSPLTDSVLERVQAIVGAARGAKVTSTGA